MRAVTRRLYQRLARLQHLARLRQARAVLFLGLLFGLFLALSLGVRSPALLPLDQRITHWAQSARSPELDFLMEGLTFLGNGGTLVFLGAAAALWFWRGGHRWGALLCLTTLLGMPLNMLLKEVVHRPRPSADAVSVVLPAIGLSFPSGHTMASTMFYGFLALMAWYHLRERPRRVLWASLFAGIALLISLSRIYLGAHWFSDVVGGWTAGLFFLLILAEVHKLVASREVTAGAALPPVRQAETGRQPKSRERGGRGVQTR